MVDLDEYYLRMNLKFGGCKTLLTLNEARSLVSIAFLIFTDLALGVHVTEFVGRIVLVDCIIISAQMYQGTIHQKRDENY